MSAVIGSGGQRVADEDTATTGEDNKVNLPAPSSATPSVARLLMVEG